MKMNSVVKLLAEVNNKQKDLVGIKVQNKFIDDAIQEQPNVTIASVPMLEDSEMIITFMPEDKQYDQLNNLVSLLKETNEGELIRKVELTKPEAPESDEEEAYMGLTPQRYEVKIGFFINMKEKVESKNFILEETKFTQVAITKELGFVAQPVKITFLFKEHTSDSRTFFSDLVDRDLGKRSTKNILNLLSDGNLSSTRLTMVSVENTDVKTSIFPLSNVISVVSPEASDSEFYLVTSSDSTLLLDQNKIKSSSIIKTMNKEYIFSVLVGRSTFLFYLKY